MERRGKKGNNYLRKSARGVFYVTLHLVQDQTVRERDSLIVFSWRFKMEEATNHKKLWGGRFNGTTDAVMERFNASSHTTDVFVSSIFKVSKKNYF
jgi:hypothetical protein